MNALACSRDHKFNIFEVTCDQHTRPTPAYIRVCRFPVHTAFLVYLSSLHVIALTVLIKSTITMEVRPYCVIFFIPPFPRVVEPITFFFFCTLLSHAPNFSRTFTDRKRVDLTTLSSQGGRGGELGWEESSFRTVPCHAHEQLKRATIQTISHDFLSDVVL
jgi:hypothetical protein